MRYRFKHVVEYSLLRGISGLANLLPYRAALGLGWTFAWLSWHLSRTPRERVTRRLKQVFGDELSDDKRREIGWVAWRNLFFNGVEILRIPSVTLKWIKKVIDYQIVEDVRDYGKRGEGLILAIPHVGNWDLAGVAVPLLGVDLATIARRQKNPLTDAYLMRMREFTGLKVWYTESKGFAGFLRRLKEGKVVAILPDLRAKARAVSVNFLGVETKVAAGMALFAHEANVPILTVYTIRIGWGRHRWVKMDPIYPDPALDRDEDIQRMTQAVMDNVTSIVREHPEQYFWFNKRWVLGKE